MKLVASLIATMALALSGLVAIPTTAQAAPYPGTVATSAGLRVPATVKKNKQLVVKYRVWTAGNARPRGTVVIRTYKVTRNGFSQVRVKSVRGYAGPAFRSTSLGKFKKKGAYRVTLRFRAAPGSVFKNSTAPARSFRVVKR